MALTAGARVGPYLVLSPLGAGGKGEVYLAEDTRLSRQVAIKRLLDAALSQADARRKIINEATAAAALSHSSIAAIYDVLDWEDQAFIVMEYVRGETLSALVAREGPLPLDRVVDIGMQLCDAVTAAHAQGIIHRDLKPANVMITPSGLIKVLDFGVARRTEAPAGATDTVAVAGTPAYMAPEQLVGRPADHRSDIYSLGVVLFELATGERPFAETDLLARAVAAASGPPKTPSRAQLPPAFGRMLARALAPDPHDRYASADEMQADLRAIGARLTELPTVDSAELHPAAWPKRRRRRFMTATVALLALAAGAFFAGRAWLARRPTRADRPVVAILPLQNDSSDQRNAYLGVGIASALTSSLASAPLTVVSRASALEIAGPSIDPRKIAGELGASYLVTGAVQVHGDQLQINLQIVRADGSVAEGISERGLRDRFLDIQSTLAAKLVEAFEVGLTAAERQRVARPPTRSADAFRLYSEARAHAERPDVPGNVTKAIDLFQRALQLDPQFALAHAGVAEASWAQYVETRQDEWVNRAVDASRQALRLDPDHPHVRVSLATVYQGTGRVDDAIAELRRALAAQPSNDEAHRVLGEILASRGETEQAVAELQQAIAARPNFARYHARLGVVYLRAGRHQEAIAALRRATELQPDSARYRHQLGSAYHASGDVQRALEHYNRAIAVGPSAETYINVGVVHYQARRYREAVAAYERAIALRPNEPQNHRALGDAYSKLGDPKRARTAYERAVTLAQKRLKVNPGDGRITAQLAVCEAKLGRFAEAVRHADAAATLAPAVSDVMYRKAVVHALAGQAPKALAAVERALKLGYSASLAAEDDDLDAIRKLPQFKSLLQTAAGDGSVR